MSAIGGQISDDGRSVPLLNVYTYLGLEDAAAEMAGMDAVEMARREQEEIIRRIV